MQNWLKESNNRQSETEARVGFYNKTASLIIASHTWRHGGYTKYCYPPNAAPSAQ
jgi:hypothetical protein